MTKKIRVAYYESYVTFLYGGIIWIALSRDKEKVFVFIKFRDAERGPPKDIELSENHRTPWKGHHSAMRNRFVTKVVRTTEIVELVLRNLSTDGFARDPSST